jgi:hypothetical protein
LEPVLRAPTGQLADSKERSIGLLSAENEGLLASPTISVTDILSPPFLLSFADCYRYIRDYDRF